MLQNLRSSVALSVHRVWTRNESCANGSPSDVCNSVCRSCSLDDDNRLWPGRRSASMDRGRPSTMGLVRLLALLLVAAMTLAPAPAQRLTPGTVLTRSLRVPPGTHTAAVTGPRRPGACRPRLRTSPSTFSGVTLLGARPEAAPDTFTGPGRPRRRRRERDDQEPDRARLQGGRLRAAQSRAPYHRRQSQLQLETAALQTSWSTRASLDWLSYHHNEKDEWLDQGAGIYVADSDRVEIDRTTIVQGQNGLMLVRANGAKIWNDDFSFNSGIGIGLYRASGNTIAHNKVDWCVRGYSHGFYNRGQGLRRHPPLRAEQPQRRRLQLRHPRRRRRVPLGGADDDGHGAGRRQRQRILPTTTSASRPPTASRRRSAAT